MQELGGMLGASPVHALDCGMIKAHVQTAEREEEERWSRAVIEP